MTMIAVKFVWVFVVFVVVCSKTIKSRIYTAENGTKQLIFEQNSGLNQDEINFLVNSLNLTTEETTPSIINNETEVLEENILKQHWNTLTEVGWKDFKKPTVYLNATKELKLAPEYMNSTKATERKDNRKSSGRSQKNNTIERHNEESSRTFLRPRRLLQKVLLPLLVILVIKYLVTLPFVAVSVFTLNAMWLGLLSIGAVLFAKFKHHDYFAHKVHNRRVAHIHGGDIYDLNSPVGSEIIWSPIRVPIAQSSISHK